MYRLSSDTISGAVDNGYIFNTIESLPGDDLSQKLQQLNVINGLKAVQDDAMHYLQTNGPDDTFQYFCTFSDSLSEIGVSTNNYSFMAAQLMWFMWACYDQLREMGLTATKWDGSLPTPSDFEAYSQKHGYTTRNLQELLRPVDSAVDDLDNDVPPDQFSPGVWQQAQVGDVVSDQHYDITFTANSGYFDQFKEGVNMQISIPCRMRVGLIDVLLQEMSFVDIARITMRNGNVHRRRAVKLLNNRIKEGKIKAPEDVTNGTRPIFERKYVLDEQRPAVVVAFGEQYHVPVKRLAFLDRKIFKSGISEQFMDSLYLEDVIKSGAFSFLSVLHLMDFYMKHYQGSIGIPSLSEMSDLDDIAFVEDGKLVVYNADRYEEEIDIENEEIAQAWKRVGNKYVLYPDRNYFLATLFNVYGCFLQE